MEECIGFLPHYYPVPHEIPRSRLRQDTRFKFERVGIKLSLRSASQSRQYRSHNWSKVIAMLSQTRVRWQYFLVAAQAKYRWLVIVVICSSAPKKNAHLMSTGHGAGFSDKLACLESLISETSRPTQLSLQHVVRRAGLAQILLDLFIPNVHEYAPFSTSTPG